MKLYFRMW